VGPGSSLGLDHNLGKVCLGDINKIPTIASQFKIDDIIITDEDIDKPTLVSLLDFCTSAGINAWFPPKLLPIINIKLNIDNFCGLPMIRLCSQKNTWLFSKIKHSVDALITVPLFILQLPLFFLIALAVKLESAGPVFYQARAVGKNGRVFTMYKFRSMRVDTGNEIHKDYVTKLIKGEIENGKDEDKPLKITDDPRVTRVGNILRKLSLDELPQLINVIKGDMSLVGPRPCLPYEFEVYQDWYKRRVSVRAGISGLWQVTGRSEVSFEDMILLDLYYIYNRSLLLDFNILFETIFVVLGKKGAY
jgi:exopolysaccharide biosynthesis polyprenyl glycosylphosphotransferase